MSFLPKKTVLFLATATQGLTVAAIQLTAADEWRDGSFEVPGSNADVGPTVSEDQTHISDVEATTEVAVAAATGPEAPTAARRPGPAAVHVSTLGGEHFTLDVEAAPVSRNIRGGILLAALRRYLQPVGPS